MPVDTAFVSKYRDDFILLAQQQKSRLSETVRPEPDKLDGKFAYFDRIGPEEMAERRSRHQDTYVVDPSHSRRRVEMSSAELGVLVDEEDLIRMGRDPKAAYTQTLLAAAARRKDSLIIRAATGTAYAIEANGDADSSATAVPLPSSQIIPDGNTGMTVAKFLLAKEMLDAAEIDEEETRYAILTARQITNMLSTTEVTSRDYTDLQALQRGKIDTFIGFKVIRTQRLDLTAGLRRCLFYSQSAIGRAMGKDADVSIDARADKSNAQQVLAKLTMGATRIIDEAVVVADCKE